VPSIQLDAPTSYDVDTKRRLAQRLGEAYARVMEARPHLVTVVVRDVGAGGVWRCTEQDPEPAALLMCDVRVGRPVETRAAVAEELIAVCSEVGGLDPSRVKVEFTQHPGDEMFHPQLGGFNRDWTPDA
jgi:phenylpyruvate tautomerase PptA (4-oxalocrotonate tautomerase family)